MQFDLFYLQELSNLLGFFQVNMTNHDWPLKACIEGSGFVGPPSILAKAYNTTRYPLVYRPQNEISVTVRTNS